MESHQAVKATPNDLVQAARIHQAAKVRLLWLYQRHERIQVESLRTYLMNFGLLVYLLPFEAVSDEACRTFDLIVIGIGKNSHREIQEVINQIRTLNLAPVVLVVDRFAYEWSLATLPAGADAVVASDTPQEVFLARCIALLRRWSLHP